MIWQRFGFGMDFTVTFLLVGRLLHCYYGENVGAKGGVEIYGCPNLHQSV